MNTSAGNGQSFRMRKLSMPMERAMQMLTLGERAVDFFKM